MSRMQDAAQAMERERVARFARRGPHAAAMTDGREHRDGIMWSKLVNQGPDASPEPLMPGAHRFGFALVEAQAGRSTGRYRRNTVEVLFVLQGRATVQWEEGGSARSQTLERWGTVTAPPGLWRSWQAEGGQPLVMLCILAGSDEVTRGGLEFWRPESAQRPMAGAQAGTRQVDWAQYADLPASEETFISGGVPGYRKTIHKVIGAGLSTLKGFRPAIPRAHPFSVSLIEIPAGEGAGLHAHTNEEIFIPLDGSFALFWRDGDQAQQQLRIGQWDLVSVPTGLWRGFLNDSDRTIHVMVVSGGTNEELKHAIEYHPEVLRQIAAFKGMTVGELVQAR